MMKLTTIHPLHLVLFSLLLLLLAVVLGAGYGQVTAQSDPTAANTALVAGSYAGSVNVREPAPLGALTLLIEITGTNGALAGQVNAIKTQVFLSSPTFTGIVTATQGVTPTLRIESQTFAGVVSGRPVQRRFLLTGEVLDNGNILRGDYAETISGFQPKPLLVKGKFLLLRPDGVTRIITVPTPRGSTPTATPPGPGGPPTVTPTATTPSVPNNPGAQDKRLYLPLISKNANNGKRAMAEEIATIEPASVAVTATPTPTAPALSWVTPTATVTPTVVAARGANQQSYLPLINQ